MSIIAGEAKTPNAIADHFKISRQAVSKHLQILLESDLVSQNQVGREIFYHFNVSSLKKLDEFIEPFRKFWEQRYSQLDELLNRQQTEKKNEPENRSKKRSRK